MPDGVRSRQCGRCRLIFEGDPTLPPDAQQEWWLCPPCRTVLLGRSGSKRTSPVHADEPTLERAISFLGVKRAVGEVASTVTQ